jgi:16S rRNA C967 or C1407 C5-methylase (RsmB/RsmF family)/NOL1/NOP2/fmu family ribosome biogenesis protein
VKGFDRLAFEAVHASGEQVTSIRINPSKINCLQPENVFPVDFHLQQKVAWCKHGYYLNERPFFTLDPLLHAGAYYVQEASSMFLWQAIEQLIPSTNNKKVLDLCAAPGGKSTLLATYFKDGLVVANEVIKLRAAVLAENIIKWGTGNVIVTNSDPSAFALMPNFFDVLVVDAPCSGSGLFRKNMDAVNEWSKENVILCSKRQQRIIADSLIALKEGGILIYSTCSYSEDENEQIADWLISNFDVASCRLPTHPEWKIIETESRLHKAFGYRFFPNQVKGEGFFIAAFKKNNSSPEKNIAAQTIHAVAHQDLQLLNDFYQFSNDYFAFTHQQEIRMIANNWVSDLKKIAKNLSVKKAGTGMGTVKGKDFIPSHEWAMSSMPLQQAATVAVDKSTALNYLRKKEITIHAGLGWKVVTYCKLPLGWIKILPNRMNNYYPSEWRILK